MGSDSGIVTFYNQDRGFGFIWSAESDLEYFFHFSEYKGPKDIEKGDVVSFKVGSSDRGYIAKEIRLTEIGRKKEPTSVGVTCWSGPSDVGEYGIINHKGEKGEGAFLHKTSLVDGTLCVESNLLYRMDVAKSKNRYIALNAGRIHPDQEVIVEKLAYDEKEDARVRVKALEMLAVRRGQETEFAEKIQRIVKTVASVPREETTLSLPFGLELSLKGTPSDNTVRIVKTLTIGGVIISGLAVANKILDEI